MNTLCILLVLLQDPPKVDRANAASTAKAALTAYKAKDLDALGAVAASSNLVILKELKEQGEKHPRWKSLFVGGRWEAVSKWSGPTLPARYFGEKLARVPFGEPTAEGRLTVVVLKWEEGKWGFEDVNFPTRESFEQGSLEAPKR
ncbi:MAG TPA: hypothetical protein VF950_25975 [Planctomycetota bacterium]